jgi:quercetin dioxygenase-like cupin family protein
MRIKHYTEVEKEAANMEGAKETAIRWVLGPADEMPNFYLRVVEVEPGGNTPRHNHPYEHEVFVLDGEGELIDPAGKALALKPGAVAYVAPDELHQFRNAGNGVFRFICLIPKIK